MTPLFYLVRKSAVNTFKDILKHPGKLAVWLAVIVILGAVIVYSFTKNMRENDAPLFWFTGILFMLITIFLGVSVLKGLSDGSAIFEMNDVNLLFGSPVDSRKILLYGIVKMAKTGFLTGLFILFQSSNFSQFGVDFGGVLLTFAAYILAMITLLTASLVIYSVTNGKPRRKPAVKIGTAALFAPLVIFSILQYFMTDDIYAMAESVLTSPFLSFIPVAGWTASGVTALIGGEAGAGVLWLGADVCLSAILIGYVLVSNPDYYEDVLVATETAFEKKRAIADGNMQAAGASDKKVKVTRTGVAFSGAAALFGKHTRESFRENRFGYLTLPSVLIALGGIVIARVTGDLSFLLFALPWAQIILIGTGRGLKETYSHYIYMIPESPFGKVVWSNVELLAKALIENVLTFGVAGMLLNAHPFYVIICIVVYTLFSYVLLGVNYAIMRFTGADVSAGMVIVIYYVAVTLVMLPGLVAATIVGYSTGGETAFWVGLLVLSAWEMLAGSVCFALSKGVLHDCDMAMMRTNTRNM